MRRAGLILLLGGAVAGCILGARWAVGRPEHDRGNGSRVQSPATRRPDPGPPPLALGEPIPDATLIAQDGRTLRLSDLRGQPLVLSFIYTRCNVTSMCPATTRRLRDLQALVRTRQLRARFLVVSFDPADRPEILQEFARRTGVDLENWDFATGPPGTVEALSRSMNTYFRKSAGEMFEHNIVVAVVDAQGRLRDEFFGAEWDVQVILESLRRASP